MQIPAGLWLLSTTPPEARDSLLGGDLWSSACFAGGVLAALGLLQALFAVALGEGRAALQRSAWLMLIVTLLMTTTLRHSRHAAHREGPTRDVSARNEARAP
jgi:hypothetical protein